MNEKDTKILQDVVARALTDAGFRAELLERPEDVLGQLSLSPEQRELVLAALKDQSTVRQLVERLTAEFGTKAAIA